MNAITQIRPFDSYGAYQREREHSRLMETRLGKALAMLAMESDRRERNGEDVSHIRAFIAEASQ